MTEKHVSLRAVHLTALALLALWALSFALSYAQLGAAGLAVSLVIAGLKSALVLLFFMELASERFSIQATAMVAIAFVTILVLFTVLDVVTRAGAPLRPPLVPREMRSGDR